MIWFTSDTHFGHDKIRYHCNRPFSCIETHDRVLAGNWNSVVKPDDTVYHLGDLAWFRGRLKSERLAELINGLNGHKYLILGDHDNPKYIKKYNVDMTVLGHYHKLIVNTKELKNQELILAHWPFLTWNKRRWGSVNAHGHLHSDGTIHRKAQIDIGVDARNYTPISIEGIVEELTKDLLGRWNDPVAMERE